MYESLRTAHGIERALVVGYEGEPAYRGNNEFLASLASTRDWLVPVAHLDAYDPPPTERLETYLSGGWVGVSLYLPDRATAEAVASWSAATLQTLDRARPIVSLNATPAATMAVEPFLRTLPNATVLFSHLGLPGRFARVPSLAEAREVMAPLLALAAHDNVGLKCSGLYAISSPPHGYPHRAADPFVTLALERYGARRLYWGSDYAPALDAVSFAQTADLPCLAGLNAAESADVMGGNLLRLLPPAC